MSSPLTLLVAKLLSRSPLQSHSSGSFAASTINCSRQQSIKRCMWKRDNAKEVAEESKRGGGMGEVEEERRYILMLDSSVTDRLSSRNCHGDASSAASLLWLPRRTNSTWKVPLVYFSFVCRNVLKLQYPLATHLFTFLPSFLPSSLFQPTPIILSFSHLPHQRPIDTHKETADMSGGRRQHEEHSISRKVDIEGPQRINREAYHQSNQHSLLPSASCASSCSSYSTSSLLQASLGRRTQRWLVRYFFSFVY